MSIINKQLAQQQLTTQLFAVENSQCTKVLNKATKIKLLALDVDGILSDGQIIYDANDVETKAFYVQDGVGIKALQQCGIQVAIITGRNSPMVARRAKELGIVHIIQGRDDKGVALTELADMLGLSLEQCAYMGDDLPDIKALQMAGLSASVPNAHTEVFTYADIVTTRLGGYGAVREICDIILKAQKQYKNFIGQYIC